MTKTDRRSDRERKRRLENREAILHAAEAVILRRGFTAASMDEVAAEADFSKATLYRYFKSKAELVFEIMIHFMDDIEARLAAARTAPGRTVRERLQDSVACLLGSLAEKENLSRVFLADRTLIKLIPLFVGRAGAGRESQFIDRLRARRADLMKGTEALLAEGIANGEFRAFDVRAASFYVAAVIEGVFTEGFWAPHKPDLEKDVSLISDFLLRGFAARTADRGETR
jgi:AcrR family transcriptional regulator